MNSEKRNKNNLIEDSYSIKFENKLSERKEQKKNHGAIEILTVHS